MIDRTRASVFALGLAIATLALGMVTHADDGGRKPPCTTPERGPSCTILRPLPQPPRVAPASAPECIVAVGGLGSDNDDYKTPGERDTFETLLAPFRSDPRYAIHRFGSSDEDPSRYRYDTYGSIDASARALRDFVRGLSGQCLRIHIVTHSMGGAVADRAFSLGLSVADGVVTYEPIAGPHNGAMIARYIARFIDMDDPFAQSASDIARTLRVHDPTTPAVRDLARITPPRPPRGVDELRQRQANDEFVFLPDNRDRRFETRDWLPDGELAQMEGHGGSLASAEVRATTVAMIRGGAVPPDVRSDRHKALALIMSVASVIIALIVGKYLQAPLLLGILTSKLITLPMGLLLPKLVGPMLGFLHFKDGVVALAKGVIDLLRFHTPQAETEEIRENGSVARIDPQVAMVRAVLDRASQLLGGR